MKFNVVFEFFSLRAYENLYQRNERIHAKALSRSRISFDKIQKDIFSTAISLKCLFKVMKK